MMRCARPLIFRMVPRRLEWLVFLMSGLAAAGMCAAGMHFLTERPESGRRALIPPNKDLSDEEPDFQREILPVLADRCFACHGPDEAANVSGLRLDLRDAAVGELPSGDGRAIVPGRPQRSELIRRIASDDPDLLMPPPGSHRHPITADELAKLQAWIAAGANYQKHWSFETLPTRIEVPEESIAGWSRNEIDRFIALELGRAGLTPSEESERWRWLRRVTLDLTGLPPSLDELDAFERDLSADAYERVVERLLASPRFGEHLAIGWLDVARYADSYGYQSDLICQVWPYRDWVVRAFNNNLPYDQFITEQLAGDLLLAPTAEQLVATAFNRLHRQTNEGGSIDLEWRIEYAADRVHTMGMAFLGLTLECARCHDHKFDPITQRDYYQLTAFFNSIDEAGTYNDAIHIPTPAVLLPTPDQARQWSELDAEWEAIETAWRDIEQQSRGDFEAWLLQAIPTVADPWSLYSLDQREGNQFADAVETGRAATTSANNLTVPGRFGEALEFSGDDALVVPAFPLKPWQPFSICFWINIPSSVRDALLWHQSTGTDTGFSGTELILSDGRLRLALSRFWPGNALAIESAEELPRDQWCFVAATYDGSGSASGMTLYIDQTSSRVVVRDHLYKTPSSGNQVSFGERFRTRGPQQGAIDHIELFDDCLSSLEVKVVRSRMAPTELGKLAWTPDDHWEYYLHRVHPGTVSLLSQKRELVSRRFALWDQIQELMVMRENQEPTATYVLERGAYDAPRSADRLVTRDTPAALPPFPHDAPRNRLGLARWLTRPDHPLTSRVAVNRVWQHFFGAGLVETAEDFGLQGSRPSHPELLDWLARDFVDHGWDIKRLCRQIVLSATYRQTSRVDRESRVRDPGNRFVARGPAQRMNGEVVRDAMLWTAGLLHEVVGGPPVSPYQPEGLWTENNAFSPPYRQSSPPDVYRRSLYSIWKRTAPLPNMLAFDAVSRETCTARRAITQSPAQALVLLNDPQFVEAALVAAHRAIDVSDLSDTERLNWLFRVATSRAPSESESTVLLRLLANQRQCFADDLDAARSLVGAGKGPNASTLATDCEWAAWTVVAQAILNSDAAIWKR